MITFLNITSLLRMRSWYPYIAFFFCFGFQAQAEEYVVARESLSAIQASGVSKNYTAQGSLDPIEQYGRSENYVLTPFTPEPTKAPEPTDPKPPSPGSPPIVLPAPEPEPSDKPHKDGGGKYDASKWLLPKIYEELKNQPEIPVESPTEKTNKPILFPTETIPSKPPKTKTPQPQPQTEPDLTVPIEPVELSSTDKKAPQQHPSQEPQKISDQESKYDASDWLLEQKYQELTEKEAQDAFEKNRKKAAEKRRQERLEAFKHKFFENEQQLNHLKKQYIQERQKNEALENILQQCRDQQLVWQQSQHYTQWISEISDMTVYLNLYQKDQSEKQMVNAEPSEFHAAPKKSLGEEEKSNLIRKFGFILIVIILFQFVLNFYFWSFVRYLKEKYHKK